MAIRVVRIKEGKGSKVMVIATWVVGKGMVRMTTRVMVTKMKEAGEEEGNSKSGKSDGNGKEDGKSERQQLQPQQQRQLRQQGQPLRHQC
jgi:hypothetical protein